MAAHTQAMEQRYAALIDAHGKAVAEKQKLAQENETLREVGCTAGLCRQPPPTPPHPPHPLRSCSSLPSLPGLEPCRTPPRRT